MRRVEIPTVLTLEDYAAQAPLTRAVVDLRSRVEPLVPKLRDRRVWMINSTALGGGVAEMLPRMVSILRELGVDTEWAVLETGNEDFFKLTKSLHNLIHGAGSIELPPDARWLYEAVARENEGWLRKQLRPQDLLVVHDPQPMGLGPLLADALDTPPVWRCHIGLDDRNERTEAAWDFLRPYAEPYGIGLFSAPEYVPGYFADRQAIIAPALDPMSPKNRRLRPQELFGILCNSGLMEAGAPTLTPDFPEPAQRLAPDGSWRPATVGGLIGLAFRPTVVQISRWDRLKGFGPLMEAFVRWKTEPSPEDHGELHTRRRAIARLVLAGPDPSSVADDPEGIEVLQELSGLYGSLEPALQADVAIVALPMSSPEQNALMVNTLQRSASLVVQNSLQEGFGLTVSEAMWKRAPVVASSAVGPRSQIESGVHGRLVRDPQNTRELAETIDEALRDSERSRDMAIAAQRRVYKEFLVFTQVARWLEELSGLVVRHAG